MRSAEDIREHLIFLLNHAMKRPGVFGGWDAAWPVMNALGFIDEDEDRIEVVDTNSRAPLRFVDERVSDPDASFYHALLLPELYSRGWFRPDHLLTAAQHADLLTGLDLWLADPRTRIEAVEAFGPPSWRHAGVFAYATADPADPMVVFGSHDGTITAAWTSEHRFPRGLRSTSAGKKLIASRPSP